MTEKILKNNQAVVAGEIISDFEFSHEVFGEGFYFVKLKVSRLSHSSDIIPLLVSERLIDVSQSHIGQFLEARGQFRSYNKHENNRNHLVLSLFVRELELIDSVENRKPNMIFLDGYICKEPVYRTTPLGREIADVLLAVNRAYGKSDYIPCICWGRNAAARAVLAYGGVPDVRKEQLFPRRKVLQTLHGGLDARAARGELRRYRVLARLARGDGHRHVPDAAVKPDRLDELKVLDLPRVQQRRAARKQRERGERRAEPEKALHFRSSFRSGGRRKARRREPGRESVSGER